MSRHALDVLHKLIELGILRAYASAQNILLRLLALFNVAYLGNPVVDGVVVYLNCGMDAPEPILGTAQLYDAAAYALDVHEHHDHERMREHIARSEMQKVVLLFLIEAEAAEKGIKEQIIFRKGLRRKIALRIYDHRHYFRVRGKLFQILLQGVQPVLERRRNEVVQPVNEKSAHLHKFHQRPPQLPARIGLSYVVVYGYGAEHHVLFHASSRPARSCCCTRRPLPGADAQSLSIPQTEALGQRAPAACQSLHKCGRLSA